MRINPDTITEFRRKHRGNVITPQDALYDDARRGYHVGIYSLWTDPAQTAANVAWVRQTWAGIQPFAAGGVYVNELGEDEGSDRVRMAYGLNYERLERIKTKYDPDNLFCLTANITPVAV